jgi:hypothetical protein
VIGYTIRIVLHVVIIKEYDKSSSHDAIIKENKDVKWMRSVIS